MRLALKRRAGIPEVAEVVVALGPIGRDPIVGKPRRQVGRNRQAVVCQGPGEVGHLRRSISVDVEDRPSGHHRLHKLMAVQDLAIGGIDQCAVLALESGQRQDHLPRQSRGVVDIEPY